MWNKARLYQGLKNYAYNKALIEKFELEKEYGISAINYSKEKVCSSPINNAENQVIRNIEIDEKISKYRYEVKMIEIALSGLEPIQREIITAKYIRRERWKDIAYNNDLSEKTLHGQKDEGLDKMLQIINW